MSPASREPRRKLRGKTDRSLRKERTKTDDHLQQKRKNVEKRTSSSIKAGRASADKARDGKRAREDAKKKKRRRGGGRLAASAKQGDKNLASERERSDLALKKERESEDQLRLSERFQKRLIAEALLETERKETDVHLLAERTVTDIEAQEQHASGELTKTALVSRDQFLAVVSHDLRTPLSAISLCGGMLRRRLPGIQADTSSLSGLVDTIEKSAAHMDRLISDLLDVERIASNKLLLEIKPHDVAKLLQECMTMFAPALAKRSSTMTIASALEPLVADIDHDRILQVLSNLIGNALKFTPAGGQITISAKKVAGEIEVAVSDNGPGIPPEKRNEIFERFSQLKSNDRRGLGLGLFIAKWIVEAHKGTIAVDSEPGKGATFRFRLPVSSK